VEFSDPTATPELQISSYTHRRHPPFSATEIIPRLFLGSSCDAQDPTILHRLRVGRILNVARECPASEEIRKQFVVLHIPLDDRSDAPIAEHFSQAVEFIREGLEERVGVLVHCRKGLSRSATMVLAFIITHGAAYLPENCVAESKAGVPYDEALDWVKQRREKICLNFGFDSALREYSNRVVICQAEPEESIEPLYSPS
jgi:protein-tyrosine phosphatase